MCNYVLLCTHECVSVGLSACVKITRLTVSAACVPASACLLCVCVRASVCTCVWEWHSHIPAISQRAWNKSWREELLTQLHYQLNSLSVLSCVVNSQDRQGTSNHISALGDLDVRGNRQFLSLCLPQSHSLWFLPRFVFLFFVLLSRAHTRKHTQARAHIFCRLLKLTTTLATTCLLLP